MPRLNASLIPAMVTPFLEDGSVDFAGAERVVHHLVDQGCDAILVNGTTGEVPTLTADEKVELFKVVQAACRERRVPLIAGVGSNDTRRSVEDAQQMARLGADALLVVVPYYNKPTQAGMVAHFSAVAQAVPDTEIVIYNIPSRCVVTMAPETMARIHAACPNVIGVKQSHPDMDAVSEITQRLPQDTWRTWCGDDTLTLPMMACGAHGTFSVLAHLSGQRMREMIDAVKAGQLDEARRLHLQQLHLGREIFFLPNPTVVKTMLARMGLIGPTLRLPLVPPEGADSARIDGLLEALQRVQPPAASLTGAAR